MKKASKNLSYRFEQLSELILVNRAKVPIFLDQETQTNLLNDWLNTNKIALNSRKKCIVFRNKLRTLGDLNIFLGG